MISVTDPTFSVERPANDARVRIVGIGGSTRQCSKSLVVLKTALGFAEEAGATAILADVRELDLPLYDDDKALDDYPASLRRLIDACESADAFIFSSATYHGTVTGAVKNVLDCLNFLWKEENPYLQGKPVGLLAMGGPGAVNTINALHHSARGLNGLSVPITAAVSGGAVNQETGEISDQTGLTRIRATVTELIDLATRLRRPVTVPLEEWEREAIVAG